MSDSLSAILSASSGPVAIFTDFDGTLVEIAATPQAIDVPVQLQGRLDRLFTALDGALAVITGRTIADIDFFLPRQQFSITGSHGAERRHAGKTDAPEAAHIEGARHILSRLEKRLAGQKGVMVEAKPTGVAVHYRAAPDKKREVERAFAETLDDFDGFHTVAGKKIIEARPIGTDKGKAVRALMQVEPFAGRVPVFLGDDVTDEDGFAAAADLGGFGIKIGKGQTRARFRFDDLASVYAYFDALIEAHGNPAMNHERLQEGLAK